MRILLFGASGMVGQGVLRECLLADDVTEVAAVVRSSLGDTHAKLRVLVHADFSDFSALAADFAGIDACFFCLGVSSSGMTEAAYTRITYDTTMAAATVLAAASPGATFIYVSGAGTDSTEHGRTMWRRVKGRTENALLALPFRATNFRPGYIQPVHGVRSRTRLYRIFYLVLSPLYPIVRRLFPNSVTSSDRVGLAMLEVAAHGPPGPHLVNRDINALAATRRAD